MHHATQPWLKHFMLVCMVLLGLQLSIPLRLQASVVSPQQIDVIGLGTKDPSDKPGVDVNLDLPPVDVLVLSVPTRTAASLHVAPGTQDPKVPTLLVVAGFHPSAP